jgi:hypothetical protein
VVNSEPEEVPDAEHEQIIERVAAIDVAKESGKVCTRLPGQRTPGRRVSKVWDVKATTNAIVELGDYPVVSGSRRSPSNQRRIIGGSGSISWKPVGAEKYGRLMRRARIRG